MRVLRLSIGFVVVLCVAWSGCGSSGLTRGKARGLIQASESFKQGTERIKLTGGEVNRGVTAGYWKLQSAFMSSVFGPVVVMTPRGKQLFEGSLKGPGGIPGRGWTIRTRQAVPARVLEVTGITDGQTPQWKIVDFTWNWSFSALPAELQSFFANAPSHLGKASLRLYDDGWRVEQVLLH